MEYVPVLFLLFAVMLVAAGYMAWGNGKTTKDKVVSNSLTVVCILIALVVLEGAISWHMRQSRLNEMIGLADLIESAERFENKNRADSLMVELKKVDAKLDKCMDHFIKCYL